MYIIISWLSDVCVCVVENGCAAKVRGGRVVKQYDIVSDMRFRERPPTKNIVIVVVAMKGVMVDGRTIARGCEKAFSEKYTERKRQV